MQNIPKILNNIALVSSTKEKLKIIKDNKSFNMMTIFKFAYNRNIVFHIVKLNTINIKYDETRNIDDRWLSSSFDLFQKLSNGEFSGNRARDKVISQMESAPKEWADLLQKILNKDLRIGVGVKLINEIYPNLLPEEFCMLAKPFAVKQLKFPCYIDTKLDGIRAISNLTKSGYILFSRNGKLLKNYKNIENELNILQKSLGNIKIIKFDGELTAGHFQDMMRTVSRKENGQEMATNTKYNIFDIAVENVPFVERLNILNSIKDLVSKLNLKYITVIEGKKVENESDLLEFYQKEVLKGKEGIMIKDLSALYECKRSSAWMKMKPEKTEDLKITGMVNGTGKYVDCLGALICKLPNGASVSVGSGFTDKNREEYWENKKEVVGKIAEIKYQEKTRDGSLRFPVFVRFREDK